MAIHRFLWLPTALGQDILTHNSHAQVRPVGRTAVIRADGGSALGMGHVMRCIGLAHELSKNRIWVTFALGVRSQPVIDRLEYEGFPFVVLGEGIGTRSDAHATSVLCTDLEASLLVIDGYEFSGEWLQSLRPGSAKTLLWADYVQSAFLPVDIILDQGPQASPAEYRVAAPAARILCGLSYAVLRPEFTSNQQLRRQRLRAEHLLVTMGGSDPAGATCKALEAIKTLVQPPATKVVIGPANNDRQQIMEVAESLAGCQVYDSVTDMSELLAWADLAISAAGTSLWEFAYSGLPALVTVLAQNQAPLASAVNDFGGGISLGNADVLSVRALADTLKTALESPGELQRMSANMLTLVDGKGAERVAAAVVDSLKTHD